jgi:hypothetical protein
MKQLHAATLSALAVATCVRTLEEAEKRDETTATTSATAGSLLQTAGGTSFACYRCCARMGHGDKERCPLVAPAPSGYAPAHTHITKNMKKCQADYSKMWLFI